MTDFTKEELETISSIFSCHFNDRGQDEIDAKLAYKIQSMIDNYCEHENDYQFNAIPIDGSVKMCKKCQEFYV